MTRNGRITRRGLLRRAAAATFAAPLVISATALGADGAVAPSERIGFGAIGYGGRGSSVLGSFMGRSEVQGIAASDVQQARLRRARDKGLAAYADFRELLDRDDIDAVVIASPSHWKPIHTIEAARAGKDVFCEKPMSRTIGEGRAMVAAIRRFGRVFQHGTQQRSSREFHFTCEMIRSGRIGQLETINVNVGGPGRDCYLPAEPVPEGVDWDTWLGPAPWRPFNSRICLTGCGGWEGYRDYSGGGLTGWGSHHFDIAQWAMDTDQTGPIEVIPPHGTDVKLLTYRYANGVTMYEGGVDSTWALVFQGTEGKIAVNRGKLQTWPESLMREPTRRDEVHLDRSRSHTGNFIEAIRTRRPAICDVEIGHHTMIVGHLGNIAHWLGRPLKWDPVKEQFAGDVAANRWLDRPRREPWTL